MMKKNGLVITADAHQIFYDYYGSGKRRLVILAHGFFNSKKSPLLRRLAEQIGGEYDVLLFDFRGHGESDGVFYWTAKEYLDMEAVLKWSGEHYETIGVIGFSLGAVSTLIACARHAPVSSLVAVSTPTQLSKIDGHFWDVDLKKDIWDTLAGKDRGVRGVRPGPFWLRKHRPIGLVGRLKTPVCYIHGAADWVIKPWHARALAAATKSEKRLEILPKGGHAEQLLKTHERQFVSIVRDWLQQTLPER
ncbi:MAG: alpha/beta hydrolase [Candidatus Omnitrophica bacterium]|nr:alpha/beta hydrolase [Candidatus Omnitrophota bacterium]